MDTVVLRVEGMLPGFQGNHWPVQVPSFGDPAEGAGVER